jgi:hypothetical protein
MRIMIKGGVWKNTEDEILKAAVMKYGKNQWARISSLLVRKSAKQCKARWYEWLDPSIKKTEWTREEDEKLLHLAKLMPTQWRTIAPIVGRTPAQCLERYEKLLDAAAQRDEDYDPADDPRRLRPGEIDPNPESKPARPDAVDMDEDEKEMLSEARARLANTKGKKAKRKAREKQLEEARRLATLQKKRELKAAGIETVKRAKRTKGLDYNAEIAFERKPAPGFYDVSEERAAQPAAFDESTFKPTTMEEMEGPRKKDLEEQLRKQDIKRAQIAERHDALGAVRVAANLNDPGAPRRRNALVLPAPRVSERELEEIAKLGKSGAAGADFEPGVEDTPGGTLLGEYARAPAGAGPAATPARTPSAGGHDAILREAAHLSVLSRGQTPLLGGENVSLAGSDFSGITPARRDAPTPNPMAAGVTPARSGAASVSATPLRDALRINDAKFSDAPLDARDAKRRAAATRDELRDGLASLPAPANEYRIEVPDAPAEERRRRATARTPWRRTWRISARARRNGGAKRKPPRSAGGRRRSAETCRALLPDRGGRRRRRRRASSRAVRSTNRRSRLPRRSSPPSSRLSSRTTPRGTRPAARRRAPPRRRPTCLASRRTRWPTRRRWWRRRFPRSGPRWATRTFPLRRSRRRSRASARRRWWASTGSWWRGRRSRRRRGSQSSSASSRRWRRRRRRTPSASPSWSTRRACSPRGCRNAPRL